MGCLELDAPSGKFVVGAAQQPLPTLPRFAGEEEGRPLSREAGEGGEGASICCRAMAYPACVSSDRRLDRNSSTADASLSHSASPIGRHSVIMPRRASQIPCA